VGGCEVVIVGAGAMGSSAAWWLARAGVDVVVLEQFEPGHRRGSSHGSTRIFRLAYPEPVYVRMARAALPLWRELENDAGCELLTITGGIDYGDPVSMQSIADSLLTCGVDFELLGAEEAAGRWPGFAFEGPVLFQPAAGRALADRTVAALQERAAAHGAQFHFSEPVESISPSAPDGAVRVRTAVREFQARTVVVTAGAWAGDLLHGLIEPPALTVTREQVFHFPSRSPDLEWPSFIHHGDTFVYGLDGPFGRGEGVKVAEHHTGARTTASGRSFEIDEAGQERVVAHVSRFMPGLEPLPSAATTCLYTSTPDQSFVMERHGPIVVGSACSGHGFKFVPLIGRRLADLAAGRPVS
jgi:sarcosine oxidase